MPRLRRFLIEIAYGMPFIVAIAVLLTVALGFNGVWVTAVSVLFGLLLGKIAEGAVTVIGAYRAAPEPPHTEPVWQIWRQRTPHIAEDR